MHERIRVVHNPDLGPEARAAHLFLEPLAAQLGLALDTIDPADATWAHAGARGAGVISWLIANEAAPAARAAAWVGNAVGLGHAQDAPAGFRLLPPSVLDPGYRLPSSRGLPDTRRPRLWDPEPFPPDAPAPGLAHPTIARVAPPDHVFEYRRGADLLLRVCRWEAGTVGTQRKLILPEIWARPAARPETPARLVPAWPADGIPLWNEDEVRARQGDWIVIAEGEKAASAARRRFPKLVAATVAGGLLGRTDWAALAGRSVLVIPDQDQTGMLYAQRVRAMVTAGGARVCRVVNLPEGAPSGWDVADPLPPGWGPGTLEAALTRTATAPVPSPDLSLLLAARRPPEPWPDDLLPAQLMPTAQALATAANVPLDFIGLPFMALPAALAGAMVDCEVRAGWTERGCLIWSAGVGDPSSGKSPAARPFAQAIEGLEDQLAREHAQRLTRWAAECATIPRGQPKPPKPMMELVRVGNTTGPAVAPLLASQGRGMTLFTDELSVFIENLSAGYRGKGSTDRPFWLKAYDAGAETYIRRTVRDGEPIRIPVLGVGITGYIQPDPLSRAMGSGGPDDGMFDRFLFAWPEPPPAAVPDMAALGLDHELAPALLAHWVGRLFNLGRHLAISETRLALRFSPEAAARFDAWRVTAIETARRERGAVTPFEGKAPGQVVRLAVARHLGAWAAGGEVLPGPIIDLNTVEVCIAAREGYFADHRDRVDQDAHEPGADKLARTLARWIVRTRAKTLNLTDLRKHVRLPGLRDVASILAAARELQASGWIPPTVILPDPRDWRAEAPTEIPLAGAVAAAIERV